MTAKMISLLVLIGEQYTFTCYGDSLFHIQEADVIQLKTWLSARFIHSFHCEWGVGHLSSSKDHRNVCDQVKVLSWCGSEISAICNSFYFPDQGNNKFNFVTVHTMLNYPGFRTILELVIIDNTVLHMYEKDVAEHPAQSRCPVPSWCIARNGDNARNRLSFQVSVFCGSCQYHSDAEFAPWLSRNQKRGAAKGKRALSRVPSLYLWNSRLVGESEHSGDKKLIISNFR